MKTKTKKMKTKKKKKKKKHERKISSAAVTRKRCGHPKSGNEKNKRREDGKKAESIQSNTTVGWWPSMKTCPTLSSVHALFCMLSLVLERH